MEWGCEGKADIIKHDMSGDHNTISRKIKATIHFVVQGIVDEKYTGWNEE
jgi:hypothetical protein